MSHKDLLSRIRAAALQKYGSLQDPHFEFVGPSLENTPLRTLADRLLSLGASVSEDTDPNNDVSIGLNITSGKDMYFLQLSVVFPAASFRRVLADGNVQQIATLADCVTTFEVECLRLLDEFGVESLDRETLLQPFDMTFPNADEDEVVVYNALFSEGNPGL